MVTLSPEIPFKALQITRSYWVVTDQRKFRGKFVAAGPGTATFLDEDGNEQVVYGNRAMFFDVEAAG